MYTQIREQLEKYKLPIALSFVGLVLILGGIFASNLNKSPGTFPKESLVQAQKLISVDVSGAVVKPGVYQLKEGSRIEEAIQQAGGFAEKANQEYISKYLNLAQKLVDGSKVYIPLSGEQTVQANTQAVAGVNGNSAKVNINTASQAKLEVLPGIGPVSATKIIEGRPYQQTEELLSKKVIGKSVYDKIKDSLVVY